MATLRTHLVDQQIRRMLRVSQRIKKLLYETFKHIEQDPSAFEELDDAPEWVGMVPNLVALRKAKVIHQKHDFRLIFAHWKWEDGSEHVDLLLVFPRKQGYQIDWEWVQRSLRD